MSKISLLLIIFTIKLISSTLLKKTMCVGHGADCGAGVSCCSEMECKEFRCVHKGEEYERLKWAKDGGVKCNWKHGCNKGYSCVDHRCVKSDEFDAYTKSEQDKLKSQMKKKEQMDLIKKLDLMRKENETD